MMSAEKAKRKARALEKYMEEQSIRRGGYANTAVSVTCSALSLQLSYRFFGIRSVPYLAMSALAGYLGGTHLGTHTVGQNSYRSTFTVEEYHLLKEQLFAHQLAEVKVESDQTDDVALREAKKVLEKNEEL